MDKKKYTFELEASPYSWMIYAQELHEAANIIIQNSTYSINNFPNLENRKTLQNAFFLNFGFSIENLMKGIAIAEKPEKIADFKISRTISTNHDLLNLLREIETIELNKNEKKLLKVLGKAIPTWGRYPIPKSYGKIENKTYYSKKIHQDLENLWDKLIRHLYSQIKDGNWVSPSGIKTGYFRDSTLEESMNSEIQKLNSNLRNGETLNKGNVDLKKTIYF